MTTEIPRYIQPLLNPKSGFLDYASLPASDHRRYNLEPEVLPLLRTATKAALLLEHKMNCTGTGHTRRCNQEVWEALEKEAGKYIEGFEIVFEGTDTAEKALIESWNSRGRKLATKLMLKEARYGVNLTNIPFKANIEDIREFMNNILEKSGENQDFPVDPWWAKKGWFHDGGCTVFLELEDAIFVMNLKKGLLFSKTREDFRRPIKITPGSDGKLAARIRPEVAQADEWD